MTKPKAIELQDELIGFTPGDEGSAAYLYYDEQNNTICVATKYALDPEDSVCGDGWDWGLGNTDLNVVQATQLKNWLVLRISEMEAVND